MNARLLNMLIGDWDRLADQWKWGTSDTGKGTLYFPIPKDRDQAFFNSNGILLKLVSKKYMPFLQGFKTKIRDINGFTTSARDFDRFFMNNLNEETWKRITAEFQLKMTNEVIDHAVNKISVHRSLYLMQRWCPDKLKDRRDNLSKYVYPIIGHPSKVL